MSKTGTYIHSSAHSGLALLVTTAYSVGVRHNVELNFDQNNVVGSTTTSGRGVAHLGGLYVVATTIAAGATSLTIRLCRDAAGDQPVIPDTTATLSTGVTTATSGCCTFKIDLDYLHSTDDLFCFVRTNLGTCTVTRLELTWSE